MYWAELAKHLQSGGCYAGTAALGYKEHHNGMAQDIAARVRSFCLAPVEPVAPVDSKKEHPGFSWYLPTRPENEFGGCLPVVQYSVVQ